VRACAKAYPRRVHPCSSTAASAITNFSPSDSLSFMHQLRSDFYRGLAQRDDDEEPAHPTRSKTVLSPQRLHQLQEHQRQHCAKLWLQLSLQASSSVTQAQRQVMIQQLQAQESCAYLQQLATQTMTGSDFELVTFAVSAVGYQKLVGLRRGDGSSLFDCVEHTQLPDLRAFVSATANLHRLNPFKAGAELVRCLEEAKKAAEEEEEEVTREEVSSVMVSAVPHGYKFLEGLYRPTGMLCLVCLCAHAAVVRTCECVFAQCGSVIARRS